MRQRARERTQPPGNHQAKVYWPCLTGAPPITHRGNGVMIPANLSALQGHCECQPTAWVTKCESGLGNV